MKIFLKLLFVFNLIIGFYIYFYLIHVNPYESCGFEHLAILRHIYVFYFLISAIFCLIAIYYQSISAYLLQTALTSILFSLGSHGICEHTSHSHITILLFIQVFIPFLLSICNIYRILSIAKIIMILMFAIIDLYFIIFMPSLINRFGG